MLDFFTIKPGVGLGSICFGATMEECRDYFGNPDEEEVEEFEGEEYINWYYGDGIIELTFEGLEDFRLGTIILSHPDATLDNEKIMGKTIAEIKQYLKRKSYFYLEELDDMENPTMLVLLVGAIECNFMFLDGLLDGVQWSYLWDDDETPNWPNIVA